MAATNLFAGDAAIIALNADDDSLVILFRRAVTVGTTIYLTDREWDGTGFVGAAGDGTISITIGPADFDAGLAVRFTAAQLASGGIDISDLGETLYLYQGSDADTPTSFLFALDIADGNTDFDGSLFGTGLIEGLHTAAIGEDNAAFATRFSNIQADVLNAALADPESWVRDDFSVQPLPPSFALLTDPPKAQLFVAGAGGGESILMVDVDDEPILGDDIVTRILHALRNDPAAPDEDHLYAPRDIALDTVAGLFFFVDSDRDGKNRIVQGSIADLLAAPGAPIDLKILYSNAGTGFAGIVHSLSIDPVNSKIYFDVNTTFNRISYDIENQVPTELADLGGSFNFINQISVDLATGTVWLASSYVDRVGSDDFVGSNRVLRATALTAQNLASASAGSLVFAPVLFLENDATFGDQDTVPHLGVDSWPKAKGALVGIDVDPDSGLVYLVARTVVLDESTAQDNSQLVTHHGGIYRYDPVTGSLTVLFLQDGVNGPVGELSYIEVDPVTGQYYVTDSTGGAGVGDGGVWIGSMGTPGTPVLFATVGNAAGLAPMGLEIQHAPTLSGTDEAESQTEAPGSPSSDPTAVQPASGFAADDPDSAGDPLGAELAGAQVRISSGFLSGSGHQDVLTIGGNQSGSILFGTGGTIDYSYDPDTGVMTLSGVATFDEYEAALGDVSFQATGDDPTAGDSSTSRTLAYSVFDGLLYSNEVLATVSVTGVNDTPFIDLDSTDADPATGTAVTYGEGQAPIFIAPDALVGDPDAPADYDGYTLTVEFTANGTVDDQLGIRSTGFGPSGILVSGNEISYGGIVVATFTGGINGANLVVNFNADACGCSLEAVAAAITFSNTAGTPSTLDRQVTFTVDDGEATNSSASAVAIVSVVANDPPVLTDLATSVTFAEDVVNAAPQLLDADVTLTDPDGNFDGGTLTVTGLLPEDVVGIRDVGTGPGEISLSGLDVLYEGVLIGTVCGCSDSLTVTFNGDATAAAVQAVIENLTYANPSDSPTASRTLFINVTDSFGADLGQSTVVGGPPHFEPRTGPDNPFEGVFVYGFSAPTFVDVDGDTDLDLVVGNAFGVLSLYEQDGGQFTPAPDIDNPFIGLALDYAAKPVFVDIDGDTDLDLVVGGAYGSLQLFENDGGVFTELTGTDNPFDGVDFGPLAAPAFADLDGDGDLDLLAGNGFGALRTFENDSGVAGVFGNFTELNSADNPLGGVLIDYGSAPVFVDLDGDGDLDLVVGDYYGKLSVFRNDGDGADAGSWDDFTALTGAANPFNSIYAGYYATPAFIDVDGDGDMDAVVGSAYGTIAHYENGPPRGQPIVVNVTQVNDAPLLDLDFQDSPEVDTTGAWSEGDPPLIVAPFAIFADPDQPADYGFYVVTVEIIANGEAEDGLAINHVGTGPGEIGVSGSDVLYEGVVVGSFTGGTNGDPLVITFNSAACACSVELALANITFANSSDDPSSLSRTITFTLADPDGAEASADAVIAITPVDDLPDANDDSNSVNENGTITGASLVANDFEPDGPPPTVEEVNGVALQDGVEITLTSGAKLTVNANGTYSYNPNGRFNTLTSTSTGQTGAVNTSATDTFTYKLVNGDTATVTITVNGVASPEDRLEGDNGNNVITGTPNPDYFYLVQGGDDDVTGLGSNDFFFFGAALGNGDKADGGPGNDQLAIQGNYAMILGSGIVNIESLVILPGSDTRFGDTANNLYDYVLITVDSNIAAGQRLVVDANRLRAGEDFTFNASAETDGNVFIVGGQGTDVLIGGSQSDTFLFGENGQWGASDIVNGSSGANDQLALRGNYTITFGAGQLLNIDSIALVSAFDTRFGNLNGAGFDYSLTMNDGNLAAGQLMTIDGGALRSEESLAFNGSAETNGNYRIAGGGGNDVITGGAGNDILIGRGRGDTLTGGAGNDIFRYDAVTDSNSTERDGIQDFNAGDIIDLSRIDANSNTAENDAFNFIGNAAFSNTAGELRFENISLGGPIWLIQGDTDGNGISDFEVVLVISPADPITAADFVL